VAIVRSSVVVYVYVSRRYWSLIDTNDEWWEGEQPVPNGTDDVDMEASSSSWLL